MGTRIGSQQILDGGVTRSDLNVDGIVAGAVAATGISVIRKVINGSGISLTSTGYDAGTGDVTLSVTTSVTDINLAAVTNIASYTGTTAVILRVIDPVRGGDFTYYTGSDAADNGMVFTDGSARKWKRRLTNNLINIQWYGAIETTGTNNDALTYINSARDYVVAHKGTNLYIPATANGTGFYVSATVTFANPIDIVGDIGSEHTAKSILAFPQNVLGFNMYNAAGYQLYSIKYLVLNTSAAGSPDRTKHGIYSNGIVHISDCGVSYFSGNGIHLEGCAIGGSAIFGANDRSTLDRVYSNYCYNGFWINGCDANVISLQNCSATSNYNWGFYDDSFLGNYYANCHTNNNGVGNPNLVSYAGNRYYSISTNYAYGGTSNQTNLNKQPDTNTTYWAFYAAGAGTAPAWNSATTYESSGPFTNTNTNAYSVYIGCYSEGGQNPSIIAQRSILIGGDQGASVSATTPYITADAGYIYLSSTRITQTRNLNFYNTATTVSQYLGLNTNQLYLRSTNVANNTITFDANGDVKIQSGSASDLFQFLSTGIARLNKVQIGATTPQGKFESDDMIRVVGSAPNGAGTTYSATYQGGGYDYFYRMNTGTFGRGGGYSNGTQGTYTSGYEGGNPGAILIGGLGALNSGGGVGLFARGGQGNVQGTGANEAEGGAGIFAEGGQFGSFSQYAVAGFFNGIVNIGTNDARQNGLVIGDAIVKRTVPAVSALLDIQSTTKGVLLSRMTTTQRTAIGSLVEGLLVYDSTLHVYYFYNGTAWTPVAGSGSSQWTTTGSDIYFGNKVMIGSASAPSTTLDVAGTGNFSGAATTGGITLQSGDNTGASNNYVQLRLSYLNTTSYSHFITTVHNAGSAATNGIRFYTGDGTAAGVYPTNAVLGLAIVNGQIGVGIIAPSASVTIKAGTATAAPLRFTSGINLTTTQGGTVEYDGTHLYFTAVDAGTRYQLDQQSGSGANALGTYIVQTATNAPANAQILGSLGTGIVKNTTTTGVLSIAVAGDFPTLNQNTTGTAAISTTATTTDDVATATAVYPSWVGATSGNNALKVSSTKLTFVPSTGALTAGSFIKSGGTSIQFLKGDGTVDSGAYSVVTLAVDTTLNQNAYPMWSTASAGAGGNWTFDTSPAKYFFNPSTGLLTTTAHALLAGTATLAPLSFASGINLTTPVAGTHEYDGVGTYITNEVTSGRGLVTTEQRFRLTATGTTISTIANYFGTTSNISLASGGEYEIEIECWFLKTTASAVTFTFTNSAAPTSMNIHYELSPITGIVTTAAATTLFGDQYNITAVAPTVVTGSLTTAVNHRAFFKIRLINGTGTSLKIQATVASGSITPGINSSWKCRRVPAANVGTFAA